MDGWKVHYIAQCQVWFYKNVFGKMEEVPDKVLRGYCLGMVMVRGI
jgi:hypothetical protein